MKKEKLKLDTKDEEEEERMKIRKTNQTKHQRQSGRQ
jgi:hypothetical protein